MIERRLCRFRQVAGGYGVPPTKTCENPAMQPLLAYFGMPGPLEMMIIAGIVLLLFGNRLPSVMRSLGKGIVEFKKGVKGIEDDIDSAGDSERIAKNDTDASKEKETAAH